MSCVAFLNACSKGHLHRLLRLTLALWVGAWVVQAGFDVIYGSLLGPGFGWDALGLGAARDGPPLGGLNTLAMANLFIPNGMKWLLLAWAIAVCTRGQGWTVPFNVFFRIATWLAMIVIGGMALRLLGLAAGLGPISPVLVLAIGSLILARPLVQAGRGDLLAIDALSWAPIRIGGSVITGFAGWLAYVSIPGLELALVQNMMPAWRPIAGYPAITEALLGAGLAVLIGAWGRAPASDETHS